MALVGNSISLRRQAINFEFFVRKFPKYFAKRSEVPFIIPYLIHQLLKWHAFPMINCSQVIEKARNKEYASQAQRGMYLISVCMFLHFGLISVSAWDLYNDAFTSALISCCIWNPCMLLQCCYIENCISYIVLQESRSLCARINQLDFSEQNTQLTLAPTR